MSNRYPPKILTLPLGSETSYSENTSGLYDGYNVDCTTVGNYTLTLTSPANRGRRFITQTGTANNLTLATAGTSATIAGAATYVMSAGDGVNVVANGLSGSSANWAAVANNVGETSVTPGTVTASKAVVVDANKDVASFRNLTLVNLDAGASATAGSVDVFPTTALKGKLSIVAADSAGNTTTTITNASQTTTGIMTIPDTNGNASFVMTAAAQTVGGAKTFSSVITPTAGVAAAGGFSASPRGMWIGQTAPQVSTDFNNSTPVITETYVSEIFVPCNMTITGIALFNGTDVTGNVTVGLADSTGAPIAAAKSASTAGAGTDAIQRIPFAVAYAAVGPATYYVQVQYSSGTARYNTHVLGNHGVLVQTSQTYGALTSFTAPTTFVTNVGNVGGLY